MATKPVTTLPNEAVAAGCMATCVSWRHDLESREDIYWYQISATAPAGWELDYISWKLGINGTPNNYTVYSKNPIPETRNIYAQYAGSLIDGWTDYITPRRVYTLSNVEAHFKRQHTPTHLLVNSANLGSPVQLVYDPASNRLVADY